MREMKYDRFTGKPFDKTSDRLPEANGHFCDECGTELIDHCIICGAPQCCPKCCAEAQDALDGTSNPKE